MGTVCSWVWRWGEPCEELYQGRGARHIYKWLQWAVLMGREVYIYIYICWWSWKLNQTERIQRWTPHFRHSAPVLLGCKLQKFLAPFGIIGPHFRSPLNPSILYSAVMFGGFQGGLTLVSMMPRDARFSNSWCNVFQSGFSSPMLLLCEVRTLSEI